MSEVDQSTNIESAEVTLNIEPQPLVVQPGDVVHLRIGIMDMGDGLPPFIPGEDELKHAKEEFQQVLPEGVKIIATHFGIEANHIPCERPDWEDPDEIRVHDPLCVYAERPYTTNCYGCQLVALRSDATYGKGEVKYDALRTLENLAATTTAHLENVWDQWETDDDQD